MKYEGPQLGNVDKYNKLFRDNGLVFLARGMFYIHIFTCLYKLKMVFVIDFILYNIRPTLLTL